MRLVKIFSPLILLLAASAVIFYADSSARSKLKAARVNGDEVSSTHKATSNPVEEYGTVSGRVFDANGRPAEGVIVTAENTALPARNLPRAETNRNGEFTIAGLTPGRYELYTKKEQDGYPRTEFNLYDVGPPTPEVTVSSRQITQGIIVGLGPKAALLNRSGD